MPERMINGTRMHYQDHGRGIPIVFIHPPLMTGGNFVYQIRGLSDAFRIVTFDIRGHGKSERSERPVTYNLIAEDIVRLMDALDINRSYVCGYSTGGSIALEVMLNDPERFYGGILVSAMSEVSDPFLKARISLAVLMSRGWANRLLTLGITRGNADRAETFRSFHRDAVRGDRQNILEYFQCSLKYNCTSRLHRLSLPQLLLYGEKDTSFFRYAAILQQHLKQTELRVIPGVSHQIPTKAADHMNRQIRQWIRNRHPDAVRNEEREVSASASGTGMMPPPAPEAPDIRDPFRAP